MVIAGIASFATVSSTLRDERITVSEDACLSGMTVSDPFTAYCQADVISVHALEATGGKTYAELDREDPLRAVARDASFLQASLFTAVVAFGVSVLAIGVGVVSILLGIAVSSGPTKQAPATSATPSS